MTEFVFKHGLGDAVYAAHLVALYVQLGYPVTVKTWPQYALLFQAAGARVTHRRVAAKHPWLYPPEYVYAGEGFDWLGNKPFGNLSRAPLPNIGKRSAWWDRFVAVRLAWKHFTSAEARQKVNTWLATLETPIVLLHSTGNSGQANKSIPADVCSDLYPRFVEACPGTLVLLDWHDRVLRLDHPRVVHLSQYGACPLDELLWLIEAADLLVGVDSGPLHVCRLTETPAVGVWMPDYYPARYSLPRAEQLNLVLPNPLNHWKRRIWNLREAEQLDAPAILQAIREQLDGHA